MDSDSSCEVVRMNSQPSPACWEACPENTEFRLKISKKGEKSLMIVYTLKEGTPLPYDPKLEGMTFNLKPQLQSHFCRHRDKF